MLHSENWSSITLRPLPEFVAKTEVPGHPETRLQVVTLEGLASLVGPDLDTDMKLCSVRAVKIYLSRSTDSRRGQKQLFISYKPGAKQEIAAATISSWIQKLSGRLMKIPLRRKQL